jgi:NADPH-dependent ferric siderophore reductase
MTIADGPMAATPPVPGADRMLEMVGRPGPLADASRLELEVSSVDAVTPSTVRLTFAGAGLTGFRCRAGHDLMFVVPAEGGGVNRRYSIRGLDPQRSRIWVDVVLHGDGPGAQWAGSVRPGDSVTAVGPRGKIHPVDGVDWHLFAVDESALPAALAMVESLAPTTRALVLAEVADEADEHPAAPRRGRAGSQPGARRRVSGRGAP